MGRAFKGIKWALLTLSVGVLLFLAWAYSSAYFPEAPTQSEEVSCSADAPLLSSGQSLKVLSWNVQFMAGKEYTFWFENGEDLRPTAEDITMTIHEVARIIADENPDIVLLQEMDNGAARTDNEDQLARLLGLLSPDYKCSARAYYWKANYLMHPKVNGSVGMELTTFSKYKIESATRHALYEIPDFFLVQWFDVKRAILETTMPIVGGGFFHALNTHLSAFAQGTDTMEQQVRQTVELLDSLSAENVPWLIGGDFNLLPPSIEKGALAYGDAQDLYQNTSEISKIFDNFKSAATIVELTGDGRQGHFTHYSNNPSATGLDRVIDYIFYSDMLAFEGYKTRQHDTQAISDHMPLIMTFELPKSD
ncbi:MAG: endonuclease/exonuclease/phosphatase family protein [Sphingomonadales bacterium]|nr:endonuclease/exonuclease/phosphatase family protein [Sphingomonadales bacterium]